MWFELPTLPSQMPSWLLVVVVDVNPVAVPIVPNFTDRSGSQEKMAGPVAIKRERVAPMEWEVVVSLGIPVAVAVVFLEMGKTDAPEEMEANPL